jgi:hypothetical protein
VPGHRDDVRVGAVLELSADKCERAVAPLERLTCGLAFAIDQLWTFLNGRLADDRTIGFRATM